MALRMAIGSMTKAKIAQFLRRFLPSLGTTTSPRVAVMQCISCARQTKIKEVTRRLRKGACGTSTSSPTVSAASHVWYCPINSCKERQVRFVSLKAERLPIVSRDKEKPILVIILSCQGQGGGKGSGAWGGGVQGQGDLRVQGQEGGDDDNWQRQWRHVHDSKGCPSLELRSA